MIEKKCGEEEKSQIKYQLHIMKALGWYISIHKGISQKEIADKMSYDAAYINRMIIMPKKAESINEENFERKQLITIAKAVKICDAMETTLENVLYYYQFRNVLTHSPKMDSLEKLTNELTSQSRGGISLAEDLEINDMVLHEEDSAFAKEVKGVNNLITNVKHPGFKSWFGKYYCYFSSTSSDEVARKRRKSFDRASDDDETKELLDCATEDYIFCGILNIHDETEGADEVCHVDFKFLANPKMRTLKKYSGTLTLSSNTNAVFCELMSKELGEKTYFILEQQDVGREYPQVQCCMAMVLTYSSKVNRRRPCCERMIISRKVIKEETMAYETMKAYLRMNDNMIRITEWGYAEMIKTIKRSSDSDLQEIMEKFPNLKSLSGINVTIEDCAFIPESIIHTLHSLNDSQRQKFEILLRIHSLAPWYCKTKGTKADTLFKLLNSE